MAHNSAPEDIRVIGARRGSIIYELLVASTIATTTSGIILAALKVAEKIYDIRIKTEELRKLKLTNKKIAEDLEKEAEIEKLKGIEAITKAEIKRLKIGESTDGDKVAALDKAVKSLVNFIDSGGEVDFIIPKESYDIESDRHKPSYDKLRVTFEEIRKIETRIRLLEPSEQ
jgi:hypothetical protein